MKNSVHSVIRFFLSLRRPSKSTNARMLQERGETLKSFTVRELTAADIPALATLHVTTWNDTYPQVRHKPTYQVRHYQWNELFKTNDGSWFCFVIENSKGELIGFAKGKREDDGSGNLNKIYLLREYQRLGLGRLLVGYTARRFLSMGISSMSVFAEATNPSCHFYEALGAKKLRHPDGKVNHGGYIWRDLSKIVSLCPIE
jgi:GNAT superfamily N-acetyltransferase